MVVKFRHGDHRAWRRQRCVVGRNVDNLTFCVFSSRRDCDRERGETPMTALHPALAIELAASFRRRAIILVLAALTTRAASAQTATGGIRGFVKDETGAVLVGVTV